MASTVARVFGQSPDARSAPIVRRWTREEFGRLIDQGMFEDQRVELIAGVIYQMSPQRFAHARAIAVVESTLRSIFASDSWVRTQLPLLLPDGSEPEPDVSVVPGHWSDYTDHPREALLVVEIASSSLQFDRHDKGSLYAWAKFADFWVLNLDQKVLEVYRNPVPDDGAPFGWRYEATQMLLPGDSIRPLARPDALIWVDALLA